MLRMVLGFVLLAVSCLTYSSLNTKEAIPLWRTRRLILYIVSGMILLGLEGLSGLLIYEGLNPMYHNLVFYLPLLLLLIIVNIEILTNVKIKINKEAFDVLMYAIVLTLLVYHVHIFAEKVVVFVAVVVTVSTIATSFLLWIYSRNIQKLVEYVDLKESGKIFTFACTLIASASIVMDTGIKHGDIFLIPAGIAFMFALLFIAKEVYVKYVSPSYRIELKYKKP